MKVIDIFWGMIRAIVLSILSNGKIMIKYPLKFCPSAKITYRDSGKIELKKHVSIGYGARIAVAGNGRLTIGQNSGIGDNNVIVSREQILIGDNVMIGPNVCIYDHDHMHKAGNIMRDQGYITAPVIIENDVWIGAGVIILKGVTIGTGSVVGAGTVVTKSIPKGSVVYCKNNLTIIDKK